MSTVHVNRSLSWEAEILQMPPEEMMRMRRCPQEHDNHLLTLIGRSLVEKQVWLSEEHQMLISCMLSLVLCQLIPNQLNPIFYCHNHLCTKKNSCTCISHTIFWRHIFFGMEMTQYQKRSSPLGKFVHQKYLNNIN